MAATAAGCARSGPWEAPGVAAFGMFARPGGRGFDAKQKYAFSAAAHPWRLAGIHHHGAAVQKAK